MKASPKQRPSSPGPARAAPARAAGQPRRLSLRLPDEAATVRLGAALARCLRPGDTVLLVGPLGAGKSALARAVIAALTGDDGAEVPSPSYTLVNVYATPRGPVWHADLYRLGGAAEEIEELGLAEAMEGDAALVLVEWPERLGGAVPARRAEIVLSAPRAGGREAAVRLHGPGWERLIALLESWQ